MSAAAGLAHSPMQELTAAEVIELLALEPHPEGGHYRETFRDVAAERGRAASTAIYYLLAAGERSRWHRVDAAEVWHWYAGASLRVSIAGEEGVQSFCLGPDLRGGAAAGRRAGACVARGRKPGRLDARRLHGCAWL